jgi:hypothetical protein
MMTHTATQVTGTNAAPRQLGRSTVAIVAGFLAVAILSLATDQVLHKLEVYPPWGQPMHDNGLNLLALSYRIIYTVLGGYITARLAPRNAMRHVLILGAIGLVFAVVGLVVSVPMNLGPVWYPAALVVTALPCTWLGGVLGRKN